MEVISGALAVAGSNFSRVKMKGNNIPIMLPTTTIRAIVSETTGMMSGARQVATIETPIAMVNPSNRETASSFPNRYTQSFPRTSPFANARIIRVADCDPAFPPLSINKGKKNIKATIDSITLSKRDMAYPENTFMTTKAISQPIRFL